MDCEQEPRDFDIYTPVEIQFDIVTPLKLALGQTAFNKFDSTSPFFFYGRFVSLLFDEMLHFKELAAMEEASSIKSYELCKIKDMQIIDISQSIASLQFFCGEWIK